MFQEQLTDCRPDRHRGRPPTDPCYTTMRTGPYTAVRDVTPLIVHERRKTKRCEVGIGKPYGKSLGSREVPVTRPLPAVLLASLGRPQLQERCSSTTLGFSIAARSRR